MTNPETTMTETLLALILLSLASDTAYVFASDGVLANSQSFHGLDSRLTRAAATQWARDRAAYLA